MLLPVGLAHSVYLRVQQSTDPHDSQSIHTPATARKAIGYAVGFTDATATAAASSVIGASADGRTVGAGRHKFARTELCAVGVGSRGLSDITAL